MNYYILMLHAVGRKGIIIYYYEQATQTNVQHTLKVWMDKGYDNFGLYQCNNINDWNKAREHKKLKMKYYYNDSLKLLGTVEDSKIHLC